MRSVPITVVGNLTDDPELRFTPTGTAVVKFTVAFNGSRWDATAGKNVDTEPSFYRVTGWRTLAENTAESLRRGDRVIVTGTLAERHYTTKEDEKRSSWEITADAIGPDLTWSVATVKKLSRDGRGDDAWSSASRTRPADTDAPPAVDQVDAAA